MEKKVECSSFGLPTQRQGEIAEMEKCNELNHLPGLYASAKHLQISRFSQAPFIPTGYTSLNTMSHYE